MSVAEHGRLTPVLRAAARAPLLRRLRASRPVSRFVEAHYRAQAVEQVWKYTLLELATRRTARYTPRGNTVDVWLRHGTSDGNIAQECNASFLYDPPAHVDVLLRGRPIRVVDLGAHVGLFAARMLSLYPDAQVTSVELTEAAYRQLERAAVHHERWDTLHAGASVRDGVVRYVHDFAESRVADEGTQSVVAIDAFALLADADLVKIDIEGAEWPILADPRFLDLAVPVIVLEWHSVGCDGDPRTVAFERVRAAGYDAVEIPDANVAERVGMLWAWRD